METTSSVSPIEVSMRRTFNINNYESLSIEGKGTHVDKDNARLLAAFDILAKAQAELIRIFNTRNTLHTSSEYDLVTWKQIELEVNGIKTELSQRGVNL